MPIQNSTGEDIYTVLVNAGSFRHVRTRGDHVILRWDPPTDHDDTEPRIVTVPLHESISIGTLRDIAESAGANDFDAFCAWIDRHR